MAKAKKNSNKKTTTKETPKVVETPKPEAQSYLVAIALLREPMEKNIPVADIFYHKSSNSFQ